MSEQNDTVLTDKDLIALNNQIIKDKKEQENLSHLLSIQNNIFNQIGMKDYISGMKEIIHNSKSFKFTNKYTEREADEHHPRFGLSYTDEALKNYELYSKQQNGYTLTQPDNDTKDAENKFTQYTTNMVLKEILTPWSDKIRDYINNDKELKQEFESLNEEDRHIIVSSIHSISVGGLPKQNRVFVSLIM